MLLHVRDVLTAAEVAQARDVLAAAPWDDGRVTAGAQASLAKFNEQLPETCEAAMQVQQLVLRGLERNALFFSATLPKQISPPLFNRYGGGKNRFDNHVDAAVRYLRQGAGRVRTDISCTLFLSNPDDYDGGELVIEDVSGEQRVKLPAGDMVVYPGTTRAPRGTGDARPSHGRLLLDPEHGAQRRAAPAALRDGHPPAPAAQHDRRSRSCRRRPDRHLPQPAAALGRRLSRRTSAMQGAPMTSLNRVCAAVVALAAAGGAMAHGDFKCDVPKAEWRKQTELQAKLLADGWKKVRQVKTDNGCYEVYGFDEKNERAEVYFNPKTFEKVGEVK